jgi:hypothetical protein
LARPRFHISRPLVRVSDSCNHPPPSPTPSKVFGSSTEDAALSNLRSRAHKAHSLLRWVEDPPPPPSRHSALCYADAFLSPPGGPGRVRRLEGVGSRHQGWGRRTMLDVGCWRGGWGDGEESGVARSLSPKGENEKRRYREGRGGLMGRCTSSCCVGLAILESIRHLGHPSTRSRRPTTKPPSLPSPSFTSVSQLYSSWGNSSRRVRSSNIWCGASPAQASAEIPHSFGRTA